MSSTSGTLFKVITFGESHGAGVGAVIDGCPAGIELDLVAIQKELTRRRPGQSHLTTPRNEEDTFEILSGLYEGRTLGTPLTLFIKNRDVKSADYKRWYDIYRPSHADYTYHIKYSHRTPLGGGRASVRETAGRVAAGAIAGQILKQELGLETVAWVDSIGDIQSSVFRSPPDCRDTVDTSLVRCPDAVASDAMVNLVEKTKADGDSIGGTIGVIVRNVPAGLGDPVYDKLEAELAHACLSIPACKGFESGSGFAGSRMCGSEHNDIFVPSDLHSNLQNKKSDNSPLKKEPPILQTLSNRSGGIQGGISNGMPITLRLAFKPTATIHKDQKSVNESGEAVTLTAHGRHDPCVLPRAVPIVEALVNLVLVDAYLRQRGRHPDWWLKFRKP